MQNIQEATAEMRATVDTILSELDAMPKECLHWKPASEVWTVMDNLCHIVEFVPYWTKQIEQVIRHPHREWGRTHHDADRLAAVADTSTLDLAQVKEDLRQGVNQSAATLEAFTLAQFATEAPSRNPRWGTKPASFIVDTLLVTHLRNHLGQIRRNLSQFQQSLAGRTEGEQT